MFERQMSPVGYKQTLWGNASRVRIASVSRHSNRDIASMTFGGRDPFVFEDQPLGFGTCAHVAIGIADMER